MRPQYAALVAAFLDSVAAASIPETADSIVVPNRLEKRANTTVIPAPINVEPSQYWEGNDGPWSSFALQVGNPKQNVRVMVSTALNNVWTVNYAGCPNGTIMGCEENRGQPFYYNESLTWIPNSIWALGFEKNLGLDTTANFGFDSVTLGWQGSGLPTVQRVVIASVSIETWWLGNFGLNPTPTNFSTFNDPQKSFMTQLKENNTIPSLSWAYTAGNQYRFAGDQYGSLVLGGYDQSKFEPTAMTTPFGSDITRDLVIGVQGINISTSSSTISATASTPGGFYAFIDSTVSHLWLPLEVCKVFESAFGIVWDEISQLYLVNDTLHTQLQKQNASVTLALGTSSSGGDSVSITLPYAAFDLEVAFPIVNDRSYYFPLKRAANSTQYTLGRTFLQEAYLIADYERRNFTIAPCAWINNAPSNIHTILSPDTSLSNGSNSSKGIGGGAIAGIVIGVLAALAALGLALWFLRRKKQGQKKRVAELEAKSAAAAAATASGDASDDNTPYEEASATKPFISHPIGGELGADNEIHEMQAQHKAPLAEMETPFGTGSYGAHDYYNSSGKGGALGVGTYSAAGGVGTWQSGISEVEGNNEPIYEMMGSDVHEMPDSRRQSWADGEEGTLDTGTHRSTKQ